jgi:ATP-binding protein involved in chromosome partitioning
MAEAQSELDQILLNALRTVVEPTGKNIVDAGLVTSLEGEGESSLLVVCEQPGYPEPVQQRLTREVIAALKRAVPELEKVRVEWKAPAPSVMDDSPPVIDKIVAVGSGKGGVGKSTIAASLAYALSRKGKRVGLMDADVYGPSIPHMLGLSGGADVVNEPNLKILPRLVDGIKVISMGLLIPPEKAVVWRGPMLHKAVKDFLYAVQWGELDVLIVDLPPGTGDIVLSLSQQMPVAGGVIVCTPQDVALLDARKAFDMFRTVNIPCLGVVENMSFFACPKCGERTEIFGCGGAQRWAGEMGVPFLGSAPINLQMRINGDEGKVRDNFAASSSARESLESIANELLRRLEEAPAKRGPTLEIVG